MQNMQYQSKHRLLPRRMSSRHDLSITESPFCCIVASSTSRRRVYRATNRVSVTVTDYGLRPGMSQAVRLRRYRAS